MKSFHQMTQKEIEDTQFRVEQDPEMADAYAVDAQSEHLDQPHDEHSAAKSGNKADTAELCAELEVALKESEACVDRAKKAGAGSFTAAEEVVAPQ